MLHGPAPARPFNENRFHYQWHWNWDYGNGDIGNQGIHEMDIARWGLGVKFPTRVSGMGGHFMFDDDQQTPNTLSSMFEFEEGGKKKFLVFEVRHWMSNHEAGIGERPAGKKKDSNTVGNIFYGSKGYLAIDGYGQYKTWLGKDQEPGPSRAEEGNNWANFIEAVRGNGSVIAPPTVGQQAAISGHMATLSFKHQIAGSVGDTSQMP